MCNDLQFKQLPIVCYHTQKIMSDADQHRFSDEIESRIAEIVQLCNKMPLDREQMLGLAKHLVDEHFTSDKSEAWVQEEEKRVWEEENPEEDVFAEFEQKEESCPEDEIVEIIEIVEFEEKKES